MLRMLHSVCYLAAEMLETLVKISVVDDFIILLLKAWKAAPRRIELSDLD